MVDVNIFEKFVKEYFELDGYFLHENINYGNNNNEADLLGIHLTNKPIHVEITEQNYSPKDLEKAIKRKFVTIQPPHKQFIFQNKHPNRKTNIL